MYFQWEAPVYNESKSRGQFPRPRNFAVGRKTLNIANSAPISANRWERPRGRYSRCRSVAERRGRSLVHGWCTPGAQRIPTHDSVCPPIRPTFPAFSPPLLAPISRIDATSCGPAPADVRVASEPRQPWTCRCWLTRLGRLPTRSSYERRGSSPPPPLPLPLPLYIGTLLQWRLINPLTQCCSFLLDKTPSRLARIVATRVCFPSPSLLEKMPVNLYNKNIKIYNIARHIFINV